MTMLAQPSKYCGPSLYAIAGLSLLISHLPSLDLFDDGELKSQGVIALGTLNVLVHHALPEDRSERVNYIQDGTVMEKGPPDGGPFFSSCGQPGQHHQASSVSSAWATRSSATSWPWGRDSIRPSGSSFCGAGAGIEIELASR